jgi:hypothetical protein
MSQRALRRAVKFAETRGIFILDREGFYRSSGRLPSEAASRTVLGFVTAGYSRTLVPSISGQRPAYAATTRSKCD